MSVIDPQAYVVEAVTRVFDVDLDAEVVRLADGRRLTNELADELAVQTLREARDRKLVPGRRSLTGGTAHSPRVQFRVPEPLREAAELRAAQQGVSLSVLAREALERYLAS